MYWRWTRRSRHLRRSARSGARWWSCAGSAAWNFPRSHRCWTSPSAPSTATGSARGRSCRPCSTRTRMDPEKLAHWQAADALFDQWLDLPATRRAAWLAGQDAQPPVLRRLEQLIAAHQRPRASMDPSGGDLAGCQLGDWTLESELGRGGMAVVYRASREQGMARQQAAV